MRRSSKAIAILLVLLSVSCVGRPAEDATGGEIYMQLCSRCHGDALEGGIGPALGPDSNAADQPDEFLRLAITNGRGRMPSFDSSLNEEQLATLIGFLRAHQAGT